MESRYLFTEERTITLSGDIIDMDPFSGGFARIKTKAGYGFIDTTGSMIIDPLLERATPFSDGLALIKSDNEYFYINENGHKIDTLPIHFDELSPFSEGLARVRIFDEYGYIFPDSSFFIRPEFQDAGNFFNGITFVSSVDSFGYILKSGEMDLVLKYELDPLRPEEVEQNMPEALRLFLPYSCNCSDSSVFPFSYDSLDLNRLITIQLEAFRWAPYLYYKYPNMLPGVIAGEGTLAGRFDFNFDFISPGNPFWEAFKQEVIFPVLQNEMLRLLAWKWLGPIYKQVFQTLPLKHREIYLGMMEYLVEYFSDYSSEKVRYFLKNNPDQFAYRHWDGTRSPYRKVSALLERLVFIHEVLDIEVVREWTARINMEISDW
jgi:hypothetical protein